MTKNSIELTNVCKSFGTRQVLTGISLHAVKGEIIGLLGPSGAGKTTLINIMTGQLAPDQGTVIVNGRVPARHRKNLSSIGIMMDDLGLYERLSVDDNLKFYARLYHVDRSRINAVLTKSGLAEARKLPVRNLSKGMRNRVNFCRALLKDIDILFLDEPTAGLDPATAKEIHNLILEKQQDGITVFLTTHNMYEAQSLCHHVALLNQGKIVAYGEPDEICRQYNHLNRIVVGRKNGETVTLENNKTCLSALTALVENEDISTIHSTEPDLESVFLELTGRRFE